MDNLFSYFVHFLAAFTVQLPAILLAEKLQNGKVQIEAHSLPARLTADLLA